MKRAGKTEERRIMKNFNAPTLHWKTPNHDLKIAPASPQSTGVPTGGRAGSEGVAFRWTWVKPEMLHVFTI